MIVDMSVLDAIHREVRDARVTGYKQIVHIRVTTDALAGSITSVPVTPERARVLGRLIALPGGGVVADLASQERLLEIVMHPEDYAELLKDAEAYCAVQFGEVERVMGIPVSG